MLLEVLVSLMNGDRNYDTNQLKPTILNNQLQFFLFNFLLH